MISVFLPESIAQQWLTALRFRMTPGVRLEQELKAALRHALGECSCGQEDGDAEDQEAERIQGGGKSKWE